MNQNILTYHHYYDNNISMLLIQMYINQHKDQHIIMIHQLILKHLNLNMLNYFHHKLKHQHIYNIQFLNQLLFTYDMVCFQNIQPHINKLHDLIYLQYLILEVMLGMFLYMYYHLMDLKLMILKHNHNHKVLKLHLQSFNLMDMKIHKHECCNFYILFNKECLNMCYLFIWHINHLPYNLYTFNQLLDM